jgi:hypothetical protein
LCSEPTPLLLKGLLPGSKARLLLMLSRGLDGRRGGIDCQWRVR